MICTAIIGATLTIISMMLVSSRREIADLHETTHEIRAYTMELLDIINPAPFDAELTEDSVEIADSHVQNDELSNRVARLKEEMALTQAKLEKLPKHTPYITPLHPDVYNLPHETIPEDTSHTVEYVK